MKKALVSIVFAFSLFFLWGFTNVNASTLNATINFDNNDKFNYFYEMKENTDFYQFLISHQYDMEGYLSSKLSNIDLSNYKYLVSIFNDNEQFPCTGHLSCPSSTQYDYTHIIRVSLFNSGGSYQYTSTPGIGDNRFFYYYNTNTNMDFYYLYYNNDTYLGNNSFRVCSSQGYGGCNIDIVESSDFDLNNIQYLMGKNYFANTQTLVSNSYINTIDVTNLIIDNDTFNIDTGFNSFWNKLKSLFTGNGWYSDYKNRENSLIEYYRYNSLIRINSYFKSLTSFFVDLNLPSGLTTLDISGYKPYLFVPKDISNTHLNRFLYTSSNLISSETAISMIDIKTDNLFSYNISAINNNSSNLIRLKYSKTNFAYSIDLSSYITKLDVENSLFDFAYQFHSIFPKGNVYIYYNSNAWDVYNIQNDFSFVNPNTNNTITLTPSEYNEIASTYDRTGESVPAYYGDDDTLDTLLSESDGNFFVNSLSKINSLVNTLSSSFALIGILITSVFDSFPAIVQEFFIAILTIGGILIIIKLVRGG